MKKLMITLALATAASFLFTGCSSVYSWFGTNKEEVHTYAVNKAFGTLDDAIAKKLDKMLADNIITEAEYKALAERAATGEEYLRKLVDDLYAKYKAKKLTKDATQDKKDTPEAAEVVIENKGNVEVAAFKMRKSKKIEPMQPKVEKPAKDQKK